MIILMIFAVLLFFLGADFIGEITNSYLQEIEQTKKEVQAAKILFSEGPGDVREIHLLEKLFEYCDQVGIRPNCYISTGRQVETQEYISLPHLVRIDKIQMKEAVDYFMRLENLPANIRVTNSRLKRVTPRPARRGDPEQPPYLEVNIEMTEISFKKSVL
jgi:hypothetical protein